MGILDRYTPTTTQSRTEHNFINQRYAAALGESGGSFLKPDIESETVYRYGDGKMKGLTSLSEALDYFKVKGNVTFEHAEKERLHTPLFVEEKASASTANQSAQLTLQDESIAFLSSATSPYGTASYPSGYPNTSNANNTATIPVRERDQVEFPDGTKAVVTAVDPVNGTFTVFPTRDGAQIPAITTDEKIIITGNLQPEGGDSNKTINGRLLTYRNTMQRLRETVEVTGDAASQIGWVKVKGRNFKGQPQDGYLWYLMNLSDSYTRHCNDIEMTLLTGEQITNQLALDALGGNTGSTEGAIPQIESHGNTEGYSTLDYTDLENMVRKLNSEHGSHDNHIWGGFDFITDLNTAMREDSNLQNGGIEYARYGDAERINNFGFSGFKINDYNFSYSTMEIFSDPNALGSEDHKYRGIGIVMPIGNTVSYDSRGDAMDVPSWRINTLRGPRGIRFKDDWAYGQFLDNQSDGKDIGKWEMLSQFGLEMFALNRYGLFLKE